MSAAGQSDVDARAVREALGRLLSSKTFARSGQLRRFLEHTVEQTLGGHAQHIKEYSIAVDVFGRRTSYDPRIDPIVRTEAQRLRKKLDLYYESEGAEDPLRIHYPKGSYVPAFVVRARARPRRSWIVALVAVAVLGILAWRLSLPRPEATTDGASSRTPRVVVLPFDDFSPDEENEDFALAMTDTVITRLAGIRGLDVVSRGSVMHLRNRSASPSEAAALLHADYVVEGSVVKSGESCRVAAQLIRASDDHSIWAESFDFPWSDIFKAQDAVSAKLVEQLAASSTQESGPPTTSVEAYEAFLKGRFSAVQFNNQRFDRYFVEAERRLLRALELDPEFVDALAELGHVYYMSLYPPRGPREETLERSRQYLERALALDPTHVTAIYTLGSVYAQSGRTEEALELSRKAVRLAPENALAHAYLGERYAEMGFFESAFAECDTAVQLDPLFLNAYVYKIQHAARLGRFDEMLLTATRSRELHPESQLLDFFLGEAYYRSGRLDAAERTWRELYERLSEEDDESYVEIAVGLLATLGGDASQGRAIFEKYRHTPDRYLSHFIELAAELGETETVVERIEHHPYFMNYRWLVTNPHLDRLKGEPAFARLTRALYSRWTDHLERFGGTLPVAPADVPSPDTYLRTVTAPSSSSLR